MKKYHPALVILHWILVPAIIIALVMGGNVLPEIPNNSPEKVGALKGHMIVGLPDIVFGGSGAALPETFDTFAPRAVHGIVSKIFFITIILHVLAALYHQFIRKDGLFGRMWFGKRK